MDWKPKTYGTLHIQSLLHQIARLEQEQVEGANELRDLRTKLREIEGHWPDAASFEPNGFAPGFAPGGSEADGSEADTVAGDR